MAHKMHDIGLLIEGKPTRCPGRQACARMRRSGSDVEGSEAVGTNVGTNEGAL
jgi:hypothetical protein